MVIFFDALEEIDSCLNVNIIIDVGDYTFSFEDPSNQYSSSNDGSADQHGECTYCSTTGAKRKIFVTELEVNNTLPYDHAYWYLYF